MCVSFYQMKQFVSGYRLAYLGTKCDGSQRISFHILEHYSVNTQQCSLNYNEIEENKPIERLYKLMQAQYEIILQISIQFLQKVITDWLPIFHLYSAFCYHKIVLRLLLLTLLIIVDYNNE